MRAFRSSSDFSSSGYLGGSPVKRPSVFLAKSHAICTCLTNGNMSGVSRVCSSTAWSIFFAAQCAAALSRIFESAVRVCRKDCVATVDIERDMRGIPQVKRSSGKTAHPFRLGERGCACRDDAYVIWLTHCSIIGMVEQARIWFDT